MVLVDLSVAWKFRKKVVSKIMALIVAKIIFCIIRAYTFQRRNVFQI